MNISRSGSCSFQTRLVVVVCKLVDVVYKMSTTTTVVELVVTVCKLIDTQNRTLCMFHSLIGTLVAVVKLILEPNISS